MNRIEIVWSKFNWCPLLFIVLLLVVSRASMAIEEGIQYYKMLSSVEYSGKIESRSQVETLLIVKKEFLSDEQAEYFISSRDFDLLKGNLDFGQGISSELSFIVDNKTKHISISSRDMALLERINNHCVMSLNKVTKQNIGKTWKQSFDLSPFGHAFPRKLRFTLTAIPLRTEMFGDMVAVRALSEPFFVKAAKSDGGLGSVKSKIGTVYLFDRDIKDVYLSISVFEATTKINGFKEELRHEIATYKSDSAGISVNLSGLDNDFENLVSKVGLSKKAAPVTRELHLPQWAQTEALEAGQVAHMCAAIACEGAPNPVVAIYMPVARTIAMQSLGTLASVGTAGVVSNTLVNSVPGFAGMKIATAPALIGGVNAGTAAAAAGVTAGTVAIVASSDEGARSPVTP